MNKKRYFFLVMAIIIFGSILTGGTYAFLTWNASVSGEGLVGESSVFNFDYSYMNDDETTSSISGLLMQTGYPRGGLNGKITMKASANNAAMANGFIYLTVESGTSSKLYSTVSAHCENPKTLETLPVYTSSTSCSSSGNTWVTSGSALKYALYRVTDVTHLDLVERYAYPVAVGHINKTGKITLRDIFVLSSKEQQYDLYIWLDGQLANSSYVSLKFSGSVSLGAEQADLMFGDIDENGTLDSDDMTLLTTFVNSGNAQALGLTTYGILNSDMNADGFVDLVDVHINSSRSLYSDYLPYKPVPLYDIVD